MSETFRNVPKMTSKPNNSERFQFDRFEMRPTERLLSCDGELVHLTPRVFDLLELLVHHSGNVVTKEELLERVWGDTVVEEGNINRTVSTLRRQLGRQSNGNDFIETVPKVGYRFLAVVSELNGSIPVAEVPTTDIRQKPPATRSSYRWLVAAAASFILISALAVVAFLFRKPRSINASAKNVPIRLTRSDANESKPVFTADGKIRFVRGEGLNSALYVVNADGTNATRDASLAVARTGEWSPDGSRILFLKDDDNRSFYMANSDGSNETKLPFMVGNAQWSSDGKRLLYQRSIKHEDGTLDSNIYIYEYETGKVGTIVDSTYFDGDPSFAPDERSILFVSDRDGNFEIYSKDLTSGEIKRITNDPAHDSFPTYSPDGTQIAFNSSRDREDFDVYIMNADGTRVRKLTDTPSNESIRNSCWSKDGTKLLFVSDSEGKDNVFVMNVEPYKVTPKLDDHLFGLISMSPVPNSDEMLVVVQTSRETSQIRLVDGAGQTIRVLASLSTAATQVAISPDGRTIAYSDKVNGSHDIFTIPIDGGEAKNITAHPNSDVSPAWSPDGLHIAFVSNRGDNRAANGIYVMNADGSDVHRLYFANSFAGSPTFTPDGALILFDDDKVDGKTGNFEIFSINAANGSDEKRLTFRRRYDVSPAVSPDGKRVAFASDIDGNSEIYLMNIDGSGVVRVTRDVGDDNWPVWSNDGKKIYFSSNRTGRFAIYEVEV